MGTKLYWSKAIAETEVKMLDANTIKNKVPKYADYLYSMHGDKWEYLLLETAQLMKHLGKNPLLNNEILKNIKIPVCLSIGDRDEMVSLDETVAAFKIIAKSSLQVFANTKHPIEKVNISLLAETVENFFSIEEK